MAGGGTASAEPVGPQAANEDLLFAYRIKKHGAAIGWRATYAKMFFAVVKCIRNCVLPPALAMMTVAFLAGAKSRLFCFARFSRDAYILPCRDLWALEIARYFAVSSKRRIQQVIIIALAGKGVAWVHHGFLKYRR